MSSGQPHGSPSGPEPRESNTAVIVIVVLVVLMFLGLCICGGVAALFWTLRAESTQQQPVIEAVPINDAEDWAAAAEAGLRIVENTPDDTLSWLRVAPVVVLAEDETAYRDFCSRMAKQFAETDDVQTAERTCKACLLVPGAIDLDQLPHTTLAKSLDEGTAPIGIASWLWCARSLVAYRSGDAESALAYAQKSEELDPSQMAQALILSIRASAHHQLDQLEESRDDVKHASEIIDGLVKSDPNLGHHHDVLMAKILLEEAKALIDGEADPKPTDTETASSSAKTDETLKEPHSVPETSKDDG